jgi:RNA-directed DNA polymerase
MNEREKSDRPVVAGKPANNGRGVPRLAELVEPRGLAKGNAAQQNRGRTQSRATLQHALDRVRQAAKKDKRMRFTALWHHVYNIDRLHEAYLGLSRKAAAGVDGETWQEYGEDLEVRLQDLSERLKQGAYRAKPVRRVYIPKADGRQRPIGVPALEDKIVQRATAEVLNAIYEVDFLGFSYGFRPGRSQHNALDALTVGIETRKVNWVLDADIRGFYDAIDHEWLMRFAEHRIADKRVLRHLKKWLKAGVLEGEQWKRLEEGTPQGGSISPLMSNIYLHYVLDLWIQQWRKRHAKGDVIVVRFADDFTVGFQYRSDAERFRRELEVRLQKFSLELHPEKTLLLEFGRDASSRRKERGLGKPETFEFLGFTHISGKKRDGRFVVQRKTARRRVQRKLRELKEELRRRLHWNPHDVGKWLRSVLLGYYRYYGVPLNYDALGKFRHAVEWLWYRALRRRSQRNALNWGRMRRRFTRRWLPNPRIYHPWPDQRLRVTTRGRSPVR